MTWRTALILGTAQGLAITPGISRSGTTIAVALMLGIQRETAARFSFLMSVPAISGAVLIKGVKADWSVVDAQAMAVGGVASMITGYAALILLVRLVQRGGFSHFCWYCWGAALVAGLLAFG